MSTVSDHVLAPMVRRLDLREALTANDRDAIYALPFTLRKVEAGQYLVRDTHFVCPEPVSRSRLPVVARNNRESRRIAS